MDDYRKEILAIPLLSQEETKNLVIQMQQGNQEARQKLITHNLRMVLKIAYQFQNSMKLPIEDLINIGVFGLIYAIDNYDPDKGSLSAIAYPAIKNTYLKYLMYTKRQKRNDERDISLQTPVYQNKDGKDITLEDTLGDTLADENVSLEDTVIGKIQSEAVKKVLQKLTKQEREILYLRYGIPDGKTHTLEEIAQMKGITREGVRQAEAKALKKLRHPRITKQIKYFID